MIVFGTNNYALKTIDPMDIGVDPSALHGLKIQRRQKYFHLMFIPTFPIGQYWALINMHLHRI